MLEETGTPASYHDKAGRKVVTYASVPFRIPAGKKKTLRATLMAQASAARSAAAKGEVWINGT